MTSRNGAHRRATWLFSHCVLALFSAVFARASLGDETAPAGVLDDVVVTAALRPTTDLTVAASVSVLDSRSLHVAGADHFEDVLAVIPNLTFAAGTNRARYFQLRGIGELDQYEGAPNPSVGLLVDDIDFSGLGSMATLFDLDRVEVLRGAQGTRYGANALAGLIYMTSAAPLPDWGARVEVGAAEYGTQSAGAVITGPLDALNASFRLAVQRYTSHGYIVNDYLHRNDTNGRDETTVRGRWRWVAAPSVQVDLSVLHVAIDDGYDAFSPQNGRITHSDKPGLDQQQSNGASVRATWSGESGQTLTAIGTWADSRMIYSYDGDWGNPLYWAPYVYDFTEVQHRHRTTEGAEIRYASAPNAATRWLVGLYAFELVEDLDDLNVGVSIDPINGEYDLHTVLDSGYRSRNASIFGLLEGDIGRRTHWSLGLRGEHHTSRYADVLNDTVHNSTDTHAFAPSEYLMGGHASVSRDWGDHHSVYAQLSRGYKAGGFNLSQGLSPSELSFRPEADWNAEMGVKSHDATTDVDVSLFVVSRQQAQLRSSVQTDPMNPNSFVFFTGNAASGLNYGLEATMRHRMTERVTVGGTLGLLRTEFHNFVRIGDTDSVSVSRELPNAPHVNGSVFADYRSPAGFYARLDVSGMSGLYYDLPPNPTQAGGYALGHLRMGYEMPRWNADLYVRNVTNRTYTTRGFYFGLEPPDYPNKLYVQLGEPRVIGAEFKVRIGSLEGR
jgi:iron complex outermembrane recepter protein